MYFSLVNVSSCWMKCTMVCMNNNVMKSYKITSLIVVKKLPKYNVPYQIKSQKRPNLDLIKDSNNVMDPEHSARDQKITASYFIFLIFLGRPSYLTSCIWLYIYRRCGDIPALSIKLLRTAWTVKSVNA